MGEVILEIRNLSNYFGMVCTARDLDLDIESGVLTSIIGPNGAGKSTLINLITGNLPVQSGTIRFLGQNVTHLPIHQRVRLGICRSFQIVNIFPCRIEVDRAFFAIGDSRKAAYIIPLLKQSAQLQHGLFTFTHYGDINGAIFKE